MKRFYGAGFVCADTLSYEFLPGMLRISGEIACLGGIVIKVEKLLRALEGSHLGATVQTFRYAYNASIRGHGSFLRHDNIHAHVGHSDAHHRHDLDWRTDAELPGSPRWVGEDGWPTLGQFIESVERWYWEHRSELPDPDGVPQLPSRD